MAKKRKYRKNRHPFTDELKYQYCRPLPGDVIPAIPDLAPDDPAWRKGMEGFHTSLGYAAAYLDRLPEGFDGWEAKDPNGDPLPFYAVKKLNWRFPRDFRGWGWVSRQGVPLACHAAKAGTLPEGDDIWKTPMSIGEPVAFAAIYSAHWIFPPDFAGWRWRNRHGTSLAAMALQHGLLPEGFSDWDVPDRAGIPLAVHAVRQGLALPPDFRDWGLADPDGTPLALIAAERGTLPDWFDDLSIRDSKGRTFWHVLAKGHVPRKGEIPDTETLKIADADGRTVAHELVRHVTLPSSFDGWLLADDKGVTVAHEAALSAHIPQDLDADWEGWLLADGQGRTVAGIAARQGVRLPAGFSHWLVPDGDGSTVAHGAALNGTLPEGFKDWLTRDGSGVTVAHVWAAGRRLPADFADWAAADATGRTVAYVAASQGNLPEDVLADPAVMLLTDGKGGTAARAWLAGKRRLPANFPDWTARDENGATLAHAAAAAGNFPRELLRDAGILRQTDGNGTPVAHELAGRCRLPPDFPAWDATTPNGRTAAYVAAAAGLFPVELVSNGDVLLLTNGRGTTVAHELVRKFRLPADFPGWAAKDAQGRTVALAAAEVGTLPDAVLADPDVMLLTGDGQTAAHAWVAKGRRLPADFPRWDARDARGWSVASVAVQAGALPESLFGDEGIMSIEDGTGCSVMETFARLEGLPRESPFWTHVFPDGSTLAHRIAKLGIWNAASSPYGIPEGFPHWALRDGEGVTVLGRFGRERRWIRGVEEFVAEVRDVLDGKDANGTLLAGHLVRLGLRIPETFDNWQVKTAEGVPFAMVAYLNGSLPIKRERIRPKDVAFLRVADGDGTTIAHLMARGGHFPACFDHWDQDSPRNRKIIDGIWTLRGPGGLTPAHIAAIRSRGVGIPADVAGIGDDDGRTPMSVARMLWDIDCFQRMRDRIGPLRDLARSRGPEGYPERGRGGGRTGSSSGGKPKHRFKTTDDADAYLQALRNLHDGVHRGVPIPEVRELVLKAEEAWKGFYGFDVSLLEDRG